MPGKDARGVFDRCAGEVEAAPVALGQVLYRLVLKNSAKGRRSASFQADLTSWLRRSQRGECDAGEAYDMFSLSAAHWAFLAALGIVSGMFLDHLFGVSFAVFPALCLFSAADAVRARRSRKNLTYRPIARRWVIPVAASVSLLAVWRVVLAGG
ncbi:hypothetical protein [Streptomyces sp. LaPpAH-108]|uniref:hypothetical protein n=1 Tax=Streptomyces sp. LaPpAH-108 TaxID=1155714 RepID=UPI00035F5D0D|nr:hypothetical protein [Streptomyces sp. LaPpAH-108]